MKGYCQLARIYGRRFRLGGLTSVVIPALSTRHSGASRNLAFAQSRPAGHTA